MNINIKMENCKFFVDKDKRRVVCVIDKTQNLVHEFFNYSGFGWSDTNETTISVSDKLYHRLTMPKRFVGVAVCAESDEWNEEVGRLIAFDRAKHKLNSSFFKRAQEYVNEIDAYLGKIITVTNNYGERLEEGSRKRKEHIKRLCPDFTEE